MVDWFGVLGLLVLVTSFLLRCWEIVVLLVGCWGSELVVELVVVEILLFEGVLMGERVLWLRLVMVGMWL